MLLPVVVARLAAIIEGMLSDAGADPFWVGATSAEQEAEAARPAYANCTAIAPAHATPIIDDVRRFAVLTEPRTMRRESNAPAPYKRHVRSLWGNVGIPGNYRRT